MELAKTLSALLLLVFMISTVSGAPSFSIEEKCESGEETLFSMYSKTGGNIGTPGHYKWQVCAEDLRNSEIKLQCGESENSVISMYSRNDSHASIYGDYNWDVCVDYINIQVNQSCSPSIFSMHSKTDSHVAEPGYYKWQVCPYYGEPERITLEMETDAGEVYVDGEEAEERTYQPLELSYPYIATDQPLGIVSYGDLTNLSYVSGSSDVFQVTQTSGSFLVPFTQGGFTEIEEEQEEVNSRSFLEQYGASFGFYISDTPEIRVSRRFEREVHGFNTTESNYIELAVRNMLNNENSTEILLTPTN